MQKISSLVADVMADEEQFLPYHGDRCTFRSTQRVLVPTERRLNKFFEHQRGLLYFHRFFASISDCTSNPKRIYGIRGCGTLTASLLMHIGTEFFRKQCGPGTPRSVKSWQFDFLPTKFHRLRSRRNCPRCVYSGGCCQRLIIVHVLHLLSRFTCPVFHCSSVKDPSLL